MDFIKAASLSELPEGSSKIVQVKNSKVALFHYNGKITAIGNACLHKGGPLGLGCVEQKYDGLYVTCPWHGWEYNIETGKAPLDYGDQQTVYEIKMDGDAILISQEPIIKAKKATHDLSALDDLIHLKYQTTGTSLNILGISTTNMNDNLTRFSTSENALEKALAYATEKYGAATKMIKLRELKFRHCEGYYSQHMNACTWPCSITEMDAKDGMTQVYRETVLWADVVLLATPIRWGNASSLYYKMAERFNTVQNQITLHKNILIKNKVAAFIITGGQDNIQSVAGQLMWFFTDLGFIFPPFSFVGWSRGWTAEDMDKNVMQFKKSDYIKRTTEELVDNCVETLSQIKNTSTVKISAPKPHRQDSPSAGIENPDMNI
ncbi:nitrite reductase/ring-hydroxylating ferredoxin subunit/multimeric flavodoxin WrbA [Flavobacterium sp. CG_23.5]|uniref:Rieske 2Fe-2S domain-containing protein n=1 Tax=unclassified Flavobacterium TaxID=196869 RepID=UPI0018C8F001|nr:MULTISPECIES: Rieske 2Fe-2S domain-containing protein [unclassified Flavobacterium]MBG6112194.1 nitrite reductase/ring-hydroxylating ferredoxin subunit/multimeric flavodoxin WrbA [Flavobacterium sp. CG_9.10]MBP2284504.1 nitrite reductase/ring-hydroxylating ferredoxin subunit/multimeric flavodoxin WrbA [Flavobacterium sp. CG_23.5]